MQCACNLFRPDKISEATWFEECNDLMSTTLLGIQRSFSTSDINTIELEINKNRSEQGIFSQRYAVSEHALDGKSRTRLFRSCSTWVAVGELASTSQLPSPHGHYNNLTTTSSQQQLSASNLTGTSSFIAVLKSVNRRARESYIRNRLLTAHRAIERLSRSEFDLDQLATTIPKVDGPGPTELKIPTFESNSSETDITATQTSPSDTLRNKSCSQNHKNRLLNTTINRNLTIHDIEKERGRPLTKYDRNMMIFNWLHSLDETFTVENNE